MRSRCGAVLQAAIFVSFVIPANSESSSPNGTIQYRQSVFASHLVEPQAVAPISRNTVLVAERSGNVVYLKQSGRIDLGNIEVDNAKIAYIGEGGTEGLKDLVPIPKTGDQFVWCATTQSESKIRWSVGRLQLTTDAKNIPHMSNSIIWQSEPQVWNNGTGSEGTFSGCRTAFNGNDLLVATGSNDRHFGSGRVMRIPIDSGGAATLVSKGHRNPGGIVVKDGNIWEVEFGPSGGDELNLIVAGGDYGWPQISKGEPQGDGEPQGSGSDKHFLASRAGSIDPTVSWTPAINPAGMTVWGGKIYISGLTGSVIELTTQGTMVVSQRQFLEIGVRVRDVRASSDGGALWVMTDGSDARLILVELDNAP